MADCRGCGAPVHWATVERTGDRVPLENFSTPGGPNRYRVQSWGQPTVVVPVGSDYQGEAYADHRTTCTLQTVRPA